MFEHRKKPIIPDSIVILPKDGASVRLERLNRFLELYIKLRKGADWNANRLNQGIDIAPDMPAFHRLEATMDASWNVLNDREKAEAIRALIGHGLIDESILEAFALLDAVPSKIAVERIQDQPKQNKGEIDKIFNKRPAGRLSAEQEAASKKKAKT